MSLREQTNRMRFCTRTSSLLVNIHIHSCLYAGAERHLGVIPLLVRRLHICQLKEDSVWGAASSLWRWKIWGMSVRRSVTCNCNHCKCFSHSTERWNYSLFFFSFQFLSNYPLLVGRGSGNKLGHDQSARECPEEAVAPLARGSREIQIGRLSGRHLWGHSASCCVPNLWRQSPWDYWGPEEESSHGCAGGAQKVRIHFCVLSGVFGGESFKKKSSLV